MLIGAHVIATMLNRRTNAAIRVLTRELGTLKSFCIHTTVISHSNWLHERNFAVAQTDNNSVICVYFILKWNWLRTTPNTGMLRVSGPILSDRENSIATMRASDLFQMVWQLRSDWCFCWREVMLSIGCEGVIKAWQWDQMTRLPLRKTSLPLFADKLCRFVECNLEAT